MVGWVALAVAVAWLAGAAAPAVATPFDVPDRNGYVTNGTVHAFARAGDRTYVGGDFTRIGKRTGSGAPMSPTGQAAPSFPEVSGGEVRAVVADGRGGWYIGGTFTSVGDQRRWGLAHVTSQGTVDTSFNPAVTTLSGAPAAVNALVLSDAAPDAGTLYVGGEFAKIGDGEAQFRGNLAALKASDAPNLADRVPTGQPSNDFGVPTSCTPLPTCSPAVHSLALTHVPLTITGSPTLQPQPLLFVGGSFKGIGPSDAPLAVDGAAAVWGDRSVDAANVSNAGVVVRDAGGTVWAPDVTPGTPDAITHVVHGFTAPPGPLAGTSTTPANPSLAVYLAGSRRTGGGAQLTPFLFARRVRFPNGGRRVAGTNESYTGWDPAIEACAKCAVRSLALADGKVYFGGDFTTVGAAATPAKRLAQIDAISAAEVDNHATSGNTITPRVPAALGPGVDGSVHTLVRRPGGPGFFVGGDFSQRILALDGSGETQSGWTATTPDAGVRAIAANVSGTAIYAGGRFGSLDSMQRRGLAAFDGTGELSAWAPQVAATGTTPPGVHALVATDGTVYAGGNFETVSGQARPGLAAIDTAGNVMSTFDATVQRTEGRPDVVSLALQGSTLYAGGSFDRMGGADRVNLAAVDAQSGGASGWRADATGVVHAILPACGAVFVGGGFDRIGGQDRDYLAALDPASGVPTGWNPAPSGSVLTLARFDGTIFAGGSFSTIAGQLRQGAAGLDVNTGGATDFDPVVDGPVQAVAASNSLVYLGGTFAKVRGHSRPRLAAVDPYTGQVTSWNPSADGIVQALSVGNDSLLVGGGFRSLGTSATASLAPFGSGAGSPFVSATCASPTRTSTSSGGSAPAGGSTEATGTTSPRSGAQNAARVGGLKVRPTRVILGRSKLKVSFTVSRATTVRLRVARRVRVRCPARTPRRIRARGCFRYKRFAEVTGRAAAGKNTLSFARQRVGRRRLVPGRYRITLAALPLARGAAQASAFFRVVRPRVVRP